MPLLAIPNVSEGRDTGRLVSFSSAAEVAGARVLDVHADEVHNRSVITLTDGGRLPTALAEVAAAAGYIDLERHQGVHPRLGGLDVCPIVPYDTSMKDAIDIAHRTGEAIWQRTSLPVYFYGEAAFRDETRELPELRKGGLAALTERARELPPDIGSAKIDGHRGVVCVGARGALIAFNVWIEDDVSVATSVAASLRTAGGGPPGIRALGLDMGSGRSQISFNLIEPDRTGVDEVFDLVERSGASIAATEIVGLVPERYMPSPDAPAARLLIEPGRSLESALLS